MEIKNKLIRWIRQQKYSGFDDPLVKLELVHLGQTKQPKLWDENVEAEFEPEETAERIFSTAESDADSLGGVQTYQIGAYFGSRKKPDRIHRFRVRGSGDELEDIDGEHTEPANAKGLVAQNMRHTEAILRGSTGTYQYVLRVLQRENEQLRTRVERLESKLFEQSEAYEELISLKHERDMERERTLNKEARMQEAFESAKMLLPGVVNRLTGKKVLPESETPQSLQLKQFMDSLDEEQLNKLTGVLKPAQMAAVFQLMEDHLDPTKKQLGSGNGRASHDETEKKP